MPAEITPQKLPPHPGKVEFVDQDAELQRSLPIDKVPVDVAWSWTEGRPPVTRIECRADQNRRMLRVEGADGKLLGLLLQVNVLPHLTRDMPPALSQRELDARYQRDIEGYAHSLEELQAAMQSLPGSLQAHVAGARLLDQYEPNNAFWADIFGTPCFQSTLRMAGNELLLYRRQMPMSGAELADLLRWTAELMAASEDCRWNTRDPRWQKAWRAAELHLFGIRLADSSAEHPAAPPLTALPEPAPQAEAVPLAEAVPQAEDGPRAEAFQPAAPAPSPTHPGQVVFVDHASRQQRVEDLRGLPRSLAWQAGGQPVTRVVTEVFSDKRSLQSYGPDPERRRNAVTMPCPCGEVFQVEAESGTKVRCPACNKPFQFFPGSRWISSRLQVSLPAEASPATHSHTRRSVEAALEYLPFMLREQVRDIRILTEPEATDVFWRKIYPSDVRFATYMLTERGAVSFFPQAMPVPDALLQTQVTRELARLWVCTHWGSPSSRAWEPWKAAIKAAARRASKAAAGSVLADFLETSVLFIAARGTRHERCRRLLPRRFALLDGVFGKRY